ncbi:MAG: tetratricopeptide repeat protein [Eggerthellaceae bacterium]|nr:tetratricopeptide repeat protein [Eggerthellaceae bacterium]
MRFEYKTREMDDPRGRPKVFFSCHPSDFSEAFDLVVEDVLEQANCVIWYDADLALGSEGAGGDGKASHDTGVLDAAREDGVPDFDVDGDAAEDLLSVLNDMQLLVFAVTSRFLEEPNRARDVELPYALERHIPVLPIMLENGLEFEFNEKCAPIQVVNRYVSDSTATPYTEVLRAFLSSVLVGDELAALVRDAFDAYVFLSYRKKNRCHAQRLMHIIHENKRFRDIAIWYDEYLVPGEGFNEAIEAAFAKSSLFALAVTPQLLEKGNYVQEIEYPMAHKRSDEDRDLEIVPVEMYEPGNEASRTNLDELASDYKDIPKVQDEYKRDELHAELDAALDRLGVTASEGSTRHLFFIGLAYLCGIDVEPDYERALDLLTQAATDEKDPCIDATEKLADMYQRGEGVGRDMDEAIRWQWLVVKQYTEAYWKHRDPDEHKGYGTKRFKALVRVADMLCEVGDTGSAMSALGEAFEFLRELAIEVGLREMERDKAVVLNRLGDLNRAHGDFDRALTCYGEARHIYGKLASQLETVRARRDLSISFERLGDVKRSLDDPTGAENCYREAGRIREDLTGSDLEPRNYRDLSVIYTKLGSVRKDGGDFRGASRFYNQALEMDRKLMEELRTPQAKDDYGVSLIKVGDVARKLGNYAEAVEKYTEAELLYAGLVKKVGSLRYRKNHARCLSKLASACKHSGDVDKAARYYEKADEEFFELLSSATGNATDMAHDLAVAYFNHAQFGRNRELAQKAHAIWEDLSSSDKRYEHYLDKADRLLKKL